MSEVNLHGTMDATVWADEWLKTIAKHPDIPQSRDTMIGWFANAIMAGYDEAKRQVVNLVEKEAPND